MERGKRKSEAASGSRLWNDFRIVLAEKRMVRAQEFLTVAIVICQVQHAAVVMHTPWVALGGDDDFAAMEKKNKGLPGVIKIPAGQVFGVPEIVRGSNHHKTVYKGGASVAVFGQGIPVV